MPHHCNLCACNGGACFSLPNGQNHFHHARTAFMGLPHSPQNFSSTSKRALQCGQVKGSCTVAIFAFGAGTGGSGGDGARPPCSCSFTRSRSEEHTSEIQSLRHL